MKDSQELFDRFREDVVDVVKTYLWTEDEVTSYADDAYRMFVRLTGGIADFTSDVTQVPIVTGEELVATDGSILRIMSASLVSDGSDVKVVNSTDLPNLMTTMDYGKRLSFTNKNVPGAVRYIVVGMQKKVAKLINIPQVDDTLALVLYRLPLKHIEDGSHPLDEVETDHHIHLLSWMKHLAYLKQDSETFDKTKSAEAEDTFRKYCALHKAEINRMQAKPRSVAYGGL